MADRRARGQQGAQVTLRHMNRRGCAALVLAGALVLARSSFALPLEGIAGWEGDTFDQGYGFAACGYLIGEGGQYLVPVRVAGSYLYYNYIFEEVEVSVRAPGVSGAVGLRSDGDWGTFTALVGGELRWESEEITEEPGSADAVARGGLVLEGEADFELSRRVHPFLLVNYSGSSNYVYGQAVLKWQCSNLDWQESTTWFIGIEGVGQGNPDTDAFQAGGTVECTFVHLDMSVALRGGYKNSAWSEESRREGGYFGVGLYRKF